MANPEYCDYKHVLPPARGYSAGRVRLQIICSACGKSGEISCSNGKSSISQSTADQAFHRRGWQIGKDRNKDLCPDCQAKPRPLTLVDIVSKPTPATALGEQLMEKIVVPAIAETPREMSRSDRQIIFAKLSDVYVNDKTGYADGWSDQRVASDLNCPVVWVSKTRDEFFGPENSNPELRQLLAKIQEGLKEIAGTVQRIEQLRQEMDLLVPKAKQLMDQSEALRKQLHNVLRTMKIDQ